MNKKMSLKDVEYCVNPKKTCKDCKYCGEEDDCRGEALIIAAKIVEEKIKEKEHEMIDKAIDKIGISRDLIDLNACYYPVLSISGPDKKLHQLNENAVCIVLKPFNNGLPPITLMIFGLEDNPNDD